MVSLKGEGGTLCGIGINSQFFIFLVMSRDCRLISLVKIARPQALMEFLSP